MDKPFTSYVPLALVWAKPSVPPDTGSAVTQTVESPSPPTAAVTFPEISPPTARAASMLGVGVVPAVTGTGVAFVSDVESLYHWDA